MSPDESYFQLKAYMGYAQYLQTIGGLTEYIRETKRVYWCKVKPVGLFKVGIFVFPKKFWKWKEETEDIRIMMKEVVPVSTLPIVNGPIAFIIHALTKGEYA